MKPNTSEKTIIELNGPGERLELILLTLMMPLWLIVFPLIGIFSPTFFTGFALIGSSFFLFLHFMHVNNGHLTFTENGIRLPGIDYRIVPYTNLKRIYLYKPRLIGVEFSPIHFTKTADNADHTTIQIIDIRYLTKEGSLQLSELLHGKVSNCDISPEIYDKLSSWPASMAQRVRWFKNFETRNISQNVFFHNNPFCKYWLCGWCLVAMIAYPIGIAGRANENASLQLVAAIAQHCPLALKKRLLWRIAITPEQSSHQEKQIWSFLLSSDLGHFYVFAIVSLVIACAIIVHKIAQRNLSDYES